MQFNLCDEPWVLVMGTDGIPKKTSLIDAFKNLRKYLSFAGEVRLQDTAILRLFCAISVTMLYRMEPDGRENFTTDKKVLMDRFKEIWKRGQFPKEMVDGYFDKWRDRFYLVGGEYPFYQVPESYAKIEVKNKGKKNEEVIYKLPDIHGNYKAMNLQSISALNGTILESKSKLSAYANAFAEGKNTMAFDEAARWLIWYMAFADCGPRVPGKGSTSWYAKPTFPSEGALVFPTGQNLFETVMLNSVLFKKESPYDSISPAWEQGPSPIIQNEPYGDAAPQNLPELYTQQSRKIMLVSTEDKITGAYLIAGDRYGTYNAFIEPMFLWKPDPSDKSNQKQIPVKYTINSSWNTLRNVLLSSETSRSVDWIHRLEDEDLLEDRNIPFLMTCVVYGDSKRAFIKHMLSDEVIVNSQFFNDSLKKNDMEKALSMINGISKAFYHFGCNLETAEGSENDLAKIRGKEVERSFLEEAEVCFRRFIKDEIDKTQMREQVQTICRNVSEHEIKRTDLNAYVNDKMTPVFAERDLWKIIHPLLKGNKKG